MFAVDLVTNLICEFYVDRGKNLTSFDGMMFAEYMKHHGLSQCNTKVYILSDTKYERRRPAIDDQEAEQPTPPPETHPTVQRKSHAADSE